MPLDPAEVASLPYVREAIARGFVEVRNDRAVYHLHKDHDYDWTDPEEWVRLALVAWLIVEKGYPPKRIDIEVLVPRRVPGDFADIVVFSDDRCRSPYLVVETKSDPQSQASRRQAIEQLIGNANSLRSPMALYDECSASILFDTSGAYPAMEREANQRGGRSAVPDQYLASPPRYRFIAGSTASDIRTADARSLENKVRRTHSVIWAGGKRDPLTSFDEWSKLLFAKVHDERTTPNGEPRRFQIGSGETATTVASRVHQLFAQAAEQDKTIFPEEIRIKLPDEKIYEIVQALQGISITNTDIDTIGHAFERFFGSVFRGELGQYFTMRQICRFMVAASDIEPDHYVIDPAAGSGGFLLEALLQVWHYIDRRFSGQWEIERLKYDFAMLHVYGIEIHEILARILKINLLLHHDGHTNIEGDRSCLDTEFTNQRLKTSWKGGFHRVLGNPPFGDTVKTGDRDLLGNNSLSAFTLGKTRTQVPSEHIILERGIEMLHDGGRLAFVIPDGLLNNQGELSNCPQLRGLLVRSGCIEAIISLPDYAFRKAGAQNKTSILFFRKFTAAERTRWANAYRAAKKQGASAAVAIEAALKAVPYRVFLAEANVIGYTPTGQKSELNDLYQSDPNGMIADDQSGSILGEMRAFRDSPGTYEGRLQPDCMALEAAAMWSAHPSHRLDPKYFLFKREESAVTPEGWLRIPIGKVMKRRGEQVHPEWKPEEEVTVLTIAQTGELRARQAGKGRTPPSWQGMYFEDMPTKWFAVCSGDVAFSGIDLWKGCIAVVPPEFDRALVSSEFPVYEIVDDRLDPQFLSALLRSRYYRRAFRAITTGHSNRRRTQPEDFEELEISFPEDIDEQRRLVAWVVDARRRLREGDAALKEAMLAFSNVIDQRGDEQYEDDLVVDEEGD